MTEPMSRRSRTRRALRLIGIAMAGAAVALGAVFVAQAGSSGGSGGSPSPTQANATSDKLGWVGTVPFCVLFLRWTQSGQAITGSAQATDLRHHLSWSQ